MKVAVSCCPMQVAGVKEYEIFLPSHHQDGRPIAQSKIDRYKQLLVEHFGGVTHMPQQNEGLWKFAGRTFRDQVTILRVLASDERKARDIFRQLRQQLEEELQQTEVLIIERNVELLD